MNNFDRIEPPTSKIKCYEFVGVASAKVSGCVYAKDLNEAIEQINNKEVHELYLEQLLSIDDIESIDES